VHGDCKPSQFLCDGGRVHLIDLDHLGMSEQAVDIGTFLASLRQLTVRQSLRSAAAARAEGTAASADLFLDAYRDTTGAADAPDLVRWHEAAALQRKALRAYARAPRSPLPLALAEEADRRLDDLGMVS